MQIRTKYNIGDTAWYMQGNKPSEQKVSRIKIDVLDNQDKNRIDIEYIMILKRNVPCDGVTIKECNLYDTKEELIASL